jgi:gluconolactonase
VLDMVRPNGLAFDPTETVLYVADSARALDEGPQHEVRAYDVRGGRVVSGGRTVAVIEPGVPDGIRVDELGNLWVSSGDSVQVLDPDGRPVARVPMPEPVGNLCFGGPDGRTLFVASTDAVHRVRTSVRDASTVARAVPAR